MQRVSLVVFTTLGAALLIVGRGDAAYGTRKGEKARSSVDYRDRLAGPGRARHHADYGVVELMPLLFRNGSLRGRNAWTVRRYEPR